MAIHGDTQTAFERDKFEHLIFTLQLHLSTARFGYFVRISLALGSKPIFQNCNYSFFLFFKFYFFSYFPLFFSPSIGFRQNKHHWSQWSQVTGNK